MKAQNVKKALVLLNNYQRNLVNAEKAKYMRKSLDSDFECPPNATIDIFMEASVLGTVNPFEFKGIPASKKLLVAIANLVENHLLDEIKDQDNQIKQL